MVVLKDVQNNLSPPFKVIDFLGHLAHATLPRDWPPKVKKFKVAQLGDFAGAMPLGPCDLAKVGHLISGCLDLFGPFSSCSETNTSLVLVVDVYTLSYHFLSFAYPFPR